MVLPTFIIYRSKYIHLKFNKYAENRDVYKNRPTQNYIINIKYNNILLCQIVLF